MCIVTISGLCINTMLHYMWVHMLYFHLTDSFAHWPQYLHSTKMAMWHIMLTGWTQRIKFAIIYIVICTGNPRVFLGVPIPVPGIYLDPLSGCGFYQGSSGCDSGVYTNPYPWRVTRGFTTIYYLLYRFIERKRKKKGIVTAGLPLNTSIYLDFQSLKSSGPFQISQNLTWGIG